MKLWKISQTKNHDWDSYDSAVVAAETEDQARHIHPNTYKTSTTWAEPEYVEVELLGEATEGHEGVIVASFNAG